jgi:hypothetical protein
VVDSNDGPSADARPPNLTDLVSLCRNLNHAQARYLVLGGMAIIQAGYVRATVVDDATSSWFRTAIGETRPRHVSPER